MSKTTREQFEALNPLPENVWWSGERGRYVGVDSNLAKVVQYQNRWEGWCSASDDTAIRKFAVALIQKMRKKRYEGKSGWDDRRVCSTPMLQKALLDHLEKGDPVDVALYCMMLWHRRGRTVGSVPQQVGPAPPVGPEGVASVLRESAKQHRSRGDLGHANLCDEYASALGMGQGVPQPPTPAVPEHIMELLEDIAGNISDNPREDAHQVVRWLQGQTVNPQPLGLAFRLHHVANTNPFCTVGHFVEHVACKLEWSGTLAYSTPLTFAEAEAAAAALGPGWRLPTRWELESLVDLSRYGPAVDTEKFPDMRSEAYWSSTRCAWDDGAIWVVHFNHGSAIMHSRSHTGYVRAVREI